MVQSCKYCGGRITGRASVCPNCGSPLGTAVDTPNGGGGNLHIEWEGAWMLVDAKIELLVNKKRIGLYPFIDGFSVDVPIEEEKTEVRVKCSFRNVKHTFDLDPNQNYNLKVTYSRITGGFGFELKDVDGHVEIDSLNGWLGLLFFLFPIVGFIYAICIRRDKPAAFASAMTTSVCGMLFWWIIRIPFSL